VRVLASDDQPLYLESMARHIEAWPEFELVGAIEPQEILPALRDLQPDATILSPSRLDDDTRDDLFAFAAAGVHLLFLTGEDGSGSYTAITRGVVGVIARTCTPRELCDAIAATARGRPTLAPAAQHQIAAEMRLRNPSIKPYLSPRQREVLQLVADGLTDKEIADRLVIAEATVKSHLRKIYPVLEVSSRTQASIVGLRHGLIY
jgi:two-component system nitrate/nitrite response regulator NarL